MTDQTKIIKFPSGEKAGRSRAFGIKDLNAEHLAEWQEARKVVLRDELGEDASSGDRHLLLDKVERILDIINLANMWVENLGGEAARTVDPMDVMLVTMEISRLFSGLNTALDAVMVLDTIFCDSNSKGERGVERVWWSKHIEGGGGR